MAVLTVITCMTCLFAGSTLTANAATYAFQDRIETVIVLNDYYCPGTKTDTRTYDKGYMGHTALILFNGCENKAVYFSFAPLNGKSDIITSLKKLSMVELNTAMTGGVAYNYLSGQELVKFLRSKSSSGNGGIIKQSIYNNGSLKRTETYETNNEISDQKDNGYKRYIAFSVSYAQGKNIFNYCYNKAMGTAIKNNPKTPDYRIACAPYAPAGKQPNEFYGNEQPYTNYQCDTFVYEALKAGNVKYRPYIELVKAYGNTGFTAAPNDSFWYFANYLAPNNAGIQYVGSTTDLFLPPIASTRQVTASSLIVRQYPHSGAANVGSLAINTKIQVVQTCINYYGEHWVRFKYNGNWCYVNAGYLKFV